MVKVRTGVQRGCVHSLLSQSSEQSQDSHRAETSFGLLKTIPHLLQFTKINHTSIFLFYQIQNTILINYLENSKLKLIKNIISNK